MKLKSLYIRRTESWESKALQFNGEVIFDSPTGEIKLAIDDETATKILQLCAHGVVAAAQQTSNMMLVDLVGTIPSLSHINE